MDVMTAAGPSRSPSRLADRRAWLGLVVLVLPTLLVALDINALFLALPKLTADLRPSGTQQLWITDSYGFMMAGFVITMGTVGDRIGRRRLLLIGAAVFGVASVVAAFATSAAMLIGVRLLLGVAGATLMPSTLALITTMFRDGRQRARAISVWATCMFAGAALGPVLGGVLLQHFWWGSVFLMAVPVMVVLLVAGPILLPEYRNPNPGRLDLTSVALSLAAVLPIVYGIKELTVDEQNGLVSVAVIVLGAGIGVVFVRRQFLLTAPLLDLRLFRDRGFTAVLTALVLVGIALAGTGLLASQYLQTVQGRTPLDAALWFAPMALAMAAGVLLAPTLTRRVRPATAIASGFVCSAVGCVLVTQVSGTGGPALVSVALAVFALGTGPLFALGTGLVVGSVPVERAGCAASMSETSNYFGSSLGMALLGATAAGMYRQRVAGAIPAGLPAAAAKAARETLAGATTAAHQLPGPAAADLLHVARDAFTSGLNVGGVVDGVIVIGLAIWFYRLRHTITMPE